LVPTPPVAVASVAVVTPATSRFGLLVSDADDI
jgi:hypothetical protein